MYLVGPNDYESTLNSVHCVGWMVLDDMKRCLGQVQLKEMSNPMVWSSWEKKVRAEDHWHNHGPQQ